MWALLFCGLETFGVADGPIAGKPAPTGDASYIQLASNTVSVGAGLPAMASGQATKKPADNHLSAGFFTSGLKA